MTGLRFIIENIESIPPIGVALIILILFINQLLEKWKDCRNEKLISNSLNNLSNKIDEHNNILKEVQPFLDENRKLVFHVKELFDNHIKDNYTSGETK